MKTPQEKYENDAQYHTLVDLIYSWIENCQYTPSEVREAAMLAAIIHEQNTVRFLPIPMSKGDEAMLDLIQWHKDAITKLGKPRSD